MGWLILKFVVLTTAIFWHLWELELLQIPKQGSELSVLSDPDDLFWKLCLNYIQKQHHFLVTWVPTDVPIVWVHPLLRYLQEKETTDSHSHI